MVRTLALTIFLLCATAQERPRSEILRERQTRYPDLYALTELARAAPPEFASVALLRVAECPRLTDPAWKHELIEEAFQSAAGAQNTRRRAMPGGRFESSLEMNEAVAGNLELDRISLQVRAVRDMLSVDPHAALDLFQRFDFPPPRTLTCSDALVDNVVDYYAVAGVWPTQLTAFEGPPERRRDEAAALVKARVDAIRSHVEIAPAAAMILNAEPSGPYEDELINSLAGVLARLPHDDRSFTASLYEITSAFAKFPRTSAIAAPDRAYLVSNLSGARCSDNLTGDWVPKVAEDAVKSFNDNFSSPNDPALAPIRGEEIKAENSGVAAVTERIATEQEQQKFDAMFQLNFGPKGRGLTDAEKNTPEWRASFTDAVKTVGDIKQEPGESDKKFFYRKSGAFKMIVVIAPPSPERDTAFDDYFHFLTTSDFQRDHLVQWFSEIEGAISLSASLYPKERNKRLQEMASSGHPVLALWARLSLVLSPQP